MSVLGWVLVFVIVERLGELVLAARNTRMLLAAGGREVGRGHYPLFILLHGGWLASLLGEAGWGAVPSWELLGLFALLQAGRVWVIVSLGRFWTTRVVTLDAAPLVRRGPYRFLRHPNYLVVAGEIALLPLAFGAYGTALVFSLLNAVLLRHRIAVEETVLAPRREAGAGSRGEAPRAPEA